LKARVALTKSLSRHRSAFEASIKPAIEKNLSRTDLVGLDRVLREISAGREGGLTESQRRGLAALDTEFRLNSQAVIRAVAIELESLVAETSKQAAQR
jgi:hypothetical protein